ncbi:BMP family ABC transporter substrate-binding protein [Mollicutes bacterium LVI A0078]|nr:BMP family ABC transporter substrate-binding protein [Mollicutes bacterium LVI A0075]WOO91466.1 BMP family ABC transporter substrate-binding protein [Mollicutes bacterium LVI A0078]
MKKILSFLTIGIIVLSGCATATGGYEFDGACDSAEPVIGFVTDAGGVNDKSFNQGTWEGIEKYCADNQVGATYVETADSSQLRDNLDLVASTEGIEVVVASGFVFANDLYSSAVSNPDTNYILIDAEPTNPETGEVEKLDNVKSYYFNEQDAGYLVGYIAGSMTESNRVGFIGGLEIPPVQRFGYGFIQGVNESNPEATIDYQYAGTFDDANTGNTIAETMIGQGTDIIFVSAGSTNDGVLKAAIDNTVTGNKVSVIGVDRDMYNEGLYVDENGTEQSVILTSAIKIVGEAAIEGLESHFSGNFTAGTTTLGYEDGGIGLPESNPNVDQKLIEEAKQSLADKETVSVNKEDIESTIKVSINGKY